MSRGPAVWLTAIALALVNVGVASLIATAIGASAFAPAWVGLLVLAMGVIAALGAVLMWRQYLAEAGRG